MKFYKAKKDLYVVIENIVSLEGHVNGTFINLVGSTYVNTEKPIEQVAKEIEGLSNES